MNPTILTNFIVRRIRQAMEKGINPDVLRDAVLEVRGYVAQDEFDETVKSLPEIKMVGNKLFYFSYVCSCGKIKSVVDRMYCQDCTEAWMDSLRLDA